MSAVKAFYMHCDYCGYDEEHAYGVTSAACRAAARADGWTHPRANRSTQLRMDLCPTCSSKVVVSKPISEQVSA